MWYNDSTMMDERDDELNELIYPYPQLEEVKLEPASHPVPFCAIDEFLSIIAPMVIRSNKLN
jgi:hypothetical protein